MMPSHTNDTRKCNLRIDLYRFTSEETHMASLSSSQHDESTWQRHVRLENAYTLPRQTIGWSLGHPSQAHDDANRGNEKRRHHSRPAVQLPHLLVVKLHVRPSAMLKITKE